MSYATIVVTYNCVSVAYSSQVRARASRFFKPLDEPKDKENPGMGYVLIRFCLCNNLGHCMHEDSLSTAGSTFKIFEHC
jgi:hypothetical protein